MVLLTVVVDDADYGGADQASKQVCKGQAEDGGLKQVLLDPEAHVNDGGVGEKGEQPADGHDSEQAVEQGRIVPLVAGQAGDHWGGRCGDCQVGDIAPAGKTGLGEGGDLSCGGCQEGGEEEEENGGGDGEGREEGAHPRLPH